MAFCPNCGTPNTDQAEKCTSCAFELSPKQKAKFKGTIMMSGVQAPAMPKPAAPPQASPPAQQAAPQPVAPKPASSPVSGPPAGIAGRNLAFEKTMLGPLAVPPNQPQATPAPVQPKPAPQPMATQANDFARAATVEGQAPMFTPPQAQPQQAWQAPDAVAVAAAAPVVQAASAPAAPAQGVWGNSTTGSSGGFGSTTGGFGGGGGGGFGGGGGGGFGGDSMAPPLPKNNTGKILAIGCAAVLALACVIGGLLFFVAREKLNALIGSAEKEGEALEWRGSLATSLTQVSALCQSNCESASVYFHPEVQKGLIGEAQQLSPSRAAKLMDPTQSEARMLNATDDSSIAEKLNLDAAQCVRIVSGTAKVVGCSVPDPNGRASLRIVHLSGVSAL